MGTTANNNWPTPVQTDLVKDGWEAIKDLGDAIDTTLGVYSPTTSGLVLLNTTSFSGVASQSVSNFTNSSYRYYRVVMDALGSTNIQWNFRFRENTTDKTTGYYGVTMYARFSGGDGGLFSSNNSGLATINAAPSSNYSTVSMDYYKAENGKARIVGTGWSGGDGDVIWFAYANDAMTDATGFTIYPNTGTFSGSVSVFGYNK
jgi:hypothetical protein